VHFDVETEFDEYYAIYAAHVDKIDKHPLEYSFSSYLRFLEEEEGLLVSIRFHDALPTNTAATLVGSNKRTTVHVDGTLRNAPPHSPAGEIVRALIAHELAHLILAHTAEFASYQANMEGFAERVDYEALQNLFDHQADIYGAIIFIARATVFERTYYFDTHNFVAGQPGSTYRDAFHTTPFQNGAFVEIRNRIRRHWRYATTSRHAISARLSAYAPRHVSPNYAIKSPPPNKGQGALLTYASIADHLPLVASLSTLILPQLTHAVNPQNSPIQVPENTG